MKIVLIGYMGSGKTAVGKILAHELQIPFMDLDAEIEKQLGCSISQIFSDKGEIYFRKQENIVLQRLLAENENFVLATGGGTPCYGNTLEMLLNNKEITTIYLKVSIQTLEARLFSDKEKRPLLAHIDTTEALNDFIRKHLFERSYFYNQAGLVVENEGSLNQTVSKIRAALL